MGAGDTQFTDQNPAGFWYGLWHGIISVIALVIHIFNDSVLVYETRNSGGWYDFGFLLGVIIIWSGGSCHISCKSAAQKKRDAKWEEIGEKVELKIMRRLKDWAENEKTMAGDQDWEEIGEKVEKKLKRKIREWAEKD
ncbi:MAG: hypothetical protein P8Y24_08150 [Gammaproteobacteria bacterium]